jgi:hypothetical protein
MYFLSLDTFMLSCVHVSSLIGIALNSVAELRFLTSCLAIASVSIVGLFSTILNILFFSRLYFLFNTK